MAINIQDELKVIDYEPRFGIPEGQPKYNTPITARENFLRFARKENPLWIPTELDVIPIMPLILPETRVRGMVADTLPFSPAEDAGGPDMFGIDWVFVPQVGGSTVKPGAPAVTDIQNWKNIIHAPDVSSWGWEDASERLKPYYSSDRLNKTIIFTGFFERLISFMDFADAAVALIDEDQQPYVHEIFEMLVGLYEDMLEHLRKYLNIDLISFHDDWGSQRAPFFSLNTCMEMIVPYLKRVVDKAHSLGMIVDFHSCGMNEPLIPAMIEAGVDLWSGQNLNDWDRISATYGDKIIYNTVWAIYNKNDFATKDEFFRQFLEKWEHYYNCPGVWLNISRVYTPGIDDEFFKMVYPISRKRLADEE